MSQELEWLEPSSPKEIIEDDLVKKHKKTKLYVLYSGGQDSGCVDDFIARKYPEYYEGRVFTCTGIGSPITRKFALQNSEELGRAIDLTWARKSYYDVVMESGFPTMGNHRIVMGYLKFQSWYYYFKDLQNKQDVCFISGVRKKESWARDKIKFYSKKPIDVNATMTFCKPFLYKNGNQLSEYMITNNVKKSPAYDWLDKSGECHCGSYSNPWELKMLEKYEPLVFGTIKWLENKVAERIKQLPREIEILESETSRVLSWGMKSKKTKLKQLIKTYNALLAHPKWGSSSGADEAVQQFTLDGFTMNEDYCGESCQVA